MTDPKPFVPLAPPPTDGHQLNTGLSTELGDSAKTAFQKINAGFEHVYSLLTGAKPDSPTGGLTSEAAGLISALNKRIAALESKPVVTDVETVAKADFDAVVAKVTALETAPAIETVAKADFDALQTRFNALADKLEVVLGLKPAPAQASAPAPTDPAPPPPPPPNQ